MKISKNSKCPCGSGKKYKECCFKWYKINSAPTPLLLMKSRYTAYVIGNADYIIKTTHKNSPHFENDLNEWKKSILEFSKSEFKKLDIIDYNNEEGYVEFKAYIDDYVMHEKSRFLKEEKWYYVGGEDEDKQISENGSTSI